MELKDYQKRVLDEVETYLGHLERHQRAKERYPSQAAWEDAGRVGAYRRRADGLGRDMPTFCIKVPTGGGKTLLATRILGSIYRTILKERKGAGLALWVVPSDQIYKDTLKRLRDRRDPYRTSLEHAVSRRIEIWEKHELHRLTPGRLAANLNILVIKLPSTNRELPEQLKFFRDSGGNVVQHFPPEGDAKAHAALKKRVPNLELLSEDPPLVKTSPGNLVRLCRPPVILDEGHKAYSSLAQRNIEGFNAAVVVELSATPDPARSNVLCRVSGQELLDEGMIKLPMNISNSGDARWENVVTKAASRREALARTARHHGIRPIVLVQVERTGKEQRGGGKIHSDDVREYLIQRLGIPKEEIAIKSSSQDDLVEVTDLEDDGCRINWIITKAALQEGWDCPFAYILVSLDNTKSKRALTQLVGRVLRQPDGAKTGIADLDESYVYCLRLGAQQIMEQVKAALEREGYEGEAAAIQDRSVDEAAVAAPVARIRPKFRKLYKPFEGKIYLPTFCVKTNDGFDGLDYFGHLVASVDVNRFDYGSIDWDLSHERQEAAETFYRVTLGQEAAERVGKHTARDWESDEAARAWLVSNLPFDHFSFKQHERIVGRALARLRGLDGHVGLVKFAVRERLVGFIEEQTDLQTHREFARLFKAGRLKFFLKCTECRFEIPQEVSVRPGRPLVHVETGELVQRSLFDKVPEDGFNEYEKAVALYIDKNPQVLWWYRNLVGEDCFAIQGYRKDRIYPDFVVQRGRGERPAPSVIVLETKGGHLAEEDRTKYTRDIAGYFEKLGRSVTWQDLGKGFEKEQFRFQILDQDEHGEWKERLESILGG